VTLQHRLEYALARTALALFRALGPAGASNLGGWLARSIGPLLPVSRVAHVNLAIAMPTLDRTARQRIVRAVWDSLGRTLGEFPHLGGLPEGPGPGPGWTIENAAGIDRLAAAGGPAILVSGHFGNWEMLPVAGAKHGMVAASFYRASDNPAVDALMIGLRTASIGPGAKLFPKGGAGARQALKHLSAGGFMGILNDQKMNDGIEARLFGRPAMTAPAAAAFALRLRCPVVPCYVLRTGPARLRVVVEPPLPLRQTGDRTADILALTQAINDRIEAWALARPETWLWLHRRFGKALYRSDSRDGRHPP
jgi:KDO2-lipid IV(A) lauroyltransferase